MSLTLNMVGGGGGKLKDTDAILSVTVPTGSAITATKGAVTLTPTIWTKADDNTLDVGIFIIPASQFDSNPWTVAVTMPNSVVLPSQTIIINAADEYDLVYGAPLYIFKEGEGAKIAYITNRESNASISVGTNAITVTRSQSTSFQTTFRTTNKIDITPYNRLKLEATVSTVSTSTYTSRIAYSASAFSGDVSKASLAAFTMLYTAGSRTVFALDVSAANGSYYVGMIGAWTGNAYNMWLEM